MKPLGWSADQLSSFLMGRSHRSKPGVAQLQDVLARTKAVLEIPCDYEVALVPGSATGAMEMGMWNLLGDRGVDTVVFDVFSRRWWGDLTHILKLEDVRVVEGGPKSLPDLWSVKGDRDLVITWGGTSSGVWIPNGSFISPQREGLVLCDVTSAAFVRPLPWDRLDFTAFSWQKGLGGEAGFGMVVLSPRAFERLRRFAPPWPIPRLLSLRHDPLVIKGEEGRAKSLFSGLTLNTVSMLAVADCLWCLGWAENHGGLEGLCRRVARNFQVLERWVDRTPWVEFLVPDPLWRSQGAVCLEIVEPTVLNASRQEKWAFLKRMETFLDQRAVAFDCLNHAEDEPALRVWCGPTVEEADLAHLLPCLEAAFHEGCVSHP